MVAATGRGRRYFSRRQPHRPGPSEAGRPAAEPTIITAWFGKKTANYGWSQQAVDELGIPGLNVGDPIDPDIIGDTPKIGVSTCRNTASWATSATATAGSSRFSVVRTGASGLSNCWPAPVCAWIHCHGVYHRGGRRRRPTYLNDPYNLPRAVGLPKVVGDLGTVLNDADGAVKSRQWRPRQHGAGVVSELAAAT